MHEEFSQIRVAALADAEKSGFAASRMLARNQTEPRWQITRFRKAGAYRAWLLEQALAPATINLRLSPAPFPSRKG